MLYKAKVNGDEDIFKKCKIIGKSNVFGYELVNEYFVDNSGFGSEDEPALTANNFLNKVKQGFYYGITFVGQFQIYIGEYKKVNRKKLMNDNNILSSKKISKSCRITEYKNGEKIITLYSTDIFKDLKDKIILNSGGYKTHTTKERINQFLYNYGFRVYQKNYEWFIENLKTNKSIEFFDNIELEAV